MNDLSDKLKETEVNNLSDKLIVLARVQDDLEAVGDDLIEAESVYNRILKVVMDAMRADPTVAELREIFETMRVEYNTAYESAQTAAIAAVTDKKEWVQDGWQVRVRTTLTPIVTGYRAFLSHLGRLDAYSIVKSVKFTLNKKAATDLAATVEGIEGMEVESSTTATLKKVEDG